MSWGEVVVVIFASDDMDCVMQLIPLNRKKSLLEGEMSLRSLRKLMKLTGLKESRKLQDP